MPDIKRREVIGWLSATVATALVPTAGATTDPPRAPAPNANPRPIQDSEDMPARETRQPFKPGWTFASFEVGSGNAAACAAALRFADDRAGRRVLWIAGPVGTGKTHLMDAVGHRRCSAIQQERIHRVHGYDFVRSHQHGDLHAFRARYRSFDTLVLDDIHFLFDERKGESRSEWLGVLDNLLERGGRAVVTADHVPKQSAMEAVLASEWAPCLEVVTIDPARFDADFRRRVLLLKAQEVGWHLPHDVATVLGRGLAPMLNVRELEGALNGLLAHSRFHGVPVDGELAKRYVRYVRAMSKANQIMAQTEKTMWQAGEMLRSRRKDA